MRASREAASSSLLSSLVFFFLLLLFSLFSLSSATAREIKPTGDARALLDFKSKADLNSSLPFNSSAFHCHWHGVQCAVRSDRVIRLVIEGLSLGGVVAADSLSQLDQLRVLSLQNDSLSGPIPDLSGLVNLKVLFLSHNSFSGRFSPSISSLHRLKTIDFSYNNLTGPLPAWLAKLDRLSSLRLEYNGFNGSVPALNQSTLSNFNVSGNNLSGLLPVTAALARFGPSSFAGNRALCGQIVHRECRPRIPFFSPTPSVEPGAPPAAAPRVETGFGQNEQYRGVALPRHGEENHKSKRLILGFSLGVLGLVGAFFCFVVTIKRVRKKNHRHRQLNPGEQMIASDRAAAADAAELTRTEEEREEKMKMAVSRMKAAAPEPVVAPAVFPAAEVGKGGGSLVFCAGEERLCTIEQLMRGAAELLGRGTMGTTYKAFLENQIIVCVKILDGTKMGVAGKEAFDRHMESVSGLRHLNLVPLRAYFQAKEERLLLYDYQPNGSLFSLIHGSKSARAKPLQWTPCLRIAEDVAQGLSYIHQARRLVHGSLKSSNVLFGSDLEVCLTDYCLTPLANDSTFNDSQHQSDPDSSRYQAPEIRV